MVDLAVIIVTWNVRDLILDALRTLYDDLEQSSLSYQVLVVDNASSDGTVDAVKESFPQTTLIASDENLGFARGNNLGMRSLGFGDESTSPDTDLPRAVYLLNCDTLTQEGATHALFDALMKDAQTGLVGAYLTYGDGSFQHSGFSFPGLRQLWVEFFPTPGRLIEGRFNGRFPQNLYAGSTPFKVDFMLGATMMLRREVILQTGMFDEQFFMYCEEIDWQWRIQKAGWKILCIPTAHVVHLGGQSTGQIRAQSMVNLWESRIKLFNKHLPRWKNWLAKKMLILGMNRKIRQSRSQQMNPELIRAYEHIRNLAQL